MQELGDGGLPAAGFTDALSDLAERIGSELPAVGRAQIHLLDACERAVQAVAELLVEQLATIDGQRDDQALVQALPDVVDQRLQGAFGRKWLAQTLTVKCHDHGAAP